jgi:hypothetical protein
MRGLVAATAPPPGATAIASFPLGPAGPAPSRVRVKLQGIDADVLVGEPAGSPKPAPR